MSWKALTAGLTAGAAVGFVYYALSTASSMQKHTIKKDASKTIKAAGSLLDDLTSMLT